MALSPMEQHVEAHVTYVDKEGPLLKIFAQTDKNQACIVEMVLYQLRETLETHKELKPKVISDIHVGLVCIAKFEDDTYYRAKIINMDKIQAEFKVTVFFMDHGNTNEIKIVDVRLVSKLVQMIPDQRVQGLAKLGNLAREFYLVGIAPKDKEWDDGTLELLRHKYCNIDLKCCVYEVEGKHFIKILNPELDPSSMLVSLSKAYPVPLGSQARILKRLNEKKTTQIALPEFNVPPPTLIMKQPPPTRFPNISQPPPARMTDGIPISHPMHGRLGGVPVRPGVPGMSMRRPEILQSNPVPVQSHQFSTELLAMGVSHPVFVSHVEDGPYSFAVQLQDVVENVLTQMMVDINNHKPQPITAPLNPGSICLGRYSTDSTLCRAIVMNVLDDKVKLYFADFGNSEILPYSEIFQIPPQFVHQKVMSHRFTLANIKDVVYSEYEKKLFTDQVRNCRSLSITVAPPEANPLKQYCELHVNGRNIKLILQELIVSQPQLRYLPLSPPLRGSQEKVFVSFVLNPGRFFVQLEKNNFTLNQVMSCVANHCKTAQLMPLVNMQVGAPCCALYEDNTWYRAEFIKPVCDNKAFINFVDYGNQEEIELSDLRQSSPELVATVKAQAIVCCLRGYELRYNVEEEISNRLEELILEKKLMMHVLGLTELGVLIVQLIDSTGQDIGTLLEATPAPLQQNHRPAQQTTQYVSPPTRTSHNHAPAPVAAAVQTNDVWEDSSPKTAPANNSWEERKYSDTRGPSDEGNKSWRNQDNSAGSRFNRDSEEKPWNKGERSNREENRGDRFNREENRSGRFNRDDNQGGRFNRDSDENRGSRFNRDSDSRGGKFNREEGGGRFNREEGGGRFNREEGGGRFNREEGGGRFNREEGGGKFNRTDDDKPWRKRDDDGEKPWKKREDEEDKPWKKRGDDSSSWRDKPRNDGGWKDRGSSGGWNKDKEDGGDKRNSRFEGGGDSGFKRSGGFKQDYAERSNSWEKGGGDTSSKVVPKSPKPDTVGGMPLSTAQVGSTEDVQVVYTTSPTEFYVQLNRSFEELNQLMERIATACESGEATDMTSIQDKAGCLAKYSEDDTWYRAVVEETTFDSAKVLFVDYGNRENVTTDKLKTLPEDMSTLPVQAVKCRLFGVAEDADVDAFSALTCEKTLKTQFVAKNFLTTGFEVIMVDEESGSNINVAMGASEDQVQMASSKLGATTLSTTDLLYPPGTTLAAQLTWYLSPAHFYLQPLQSHADFRAMMQAMQSIVRTGTVKQNSELNIGDVVIARFKADRAVYRAVVIEAGFAPKVQYVDYGNTEPVISGAVWAMEPQYATLPVQAFSCSLVGVRPVAEAWPPAETTALDSQFEAESLECVVVSLADSEPWYRVRLTKQGQDVAQSIVDAGFGVADVEPVSELDTALLVGQVLPVTLLRVEDNYTVYMQPLAEDTELLSLVVGEEGIKCALSGVREDVSEEQQTRFKQLASGSNAIVRVDAVLTDGLQVTMYDAEGQLLPVQTTEQTEMEVICALPVLNTHQRVTVAHAGEEGIFLHKTAFADLLSNLLQKLYDFYNESENVEQDWTVGQICCALSANDEQWYRAKIMETGEMIKVQYLDYGNSESLPISNLRKLDPSFYTPHAYVLSVSLHVTWSVPVENLLELAGETEYNAVVLRSGDGWVVELVHNSGQSLTEKLVELGFAAALDNSPFKRVVEGGKFVEGSDIAVSVSFIDSPHQLWIHVGDDIEKIEALQDRLQEAAARLPSLQEPNGIFAAKFSDELWYRAVKLESSTVRFIDYGNSDVVDLSDIKILSADFLEPSEGYAVKVELPVSEFKEGATERLEELLVSPEIETGEEIKAHILGVKETHIVADIVKGGKSVVEILVEEGLATRLQIATLGFVSNITSLSDFFVQEVGCEEALETMTNIMLTNDSFEPVSEVQEGDIIAALFNDDGQWYRAKVTKKTDETTEVLFIDYGNSAEATEFKTLPAELANKPALAKHYTLQKPDGVAEWPQAANEKFVEISADGCTQFEVNVLNQEEPATVMLFYNETNLTEELKELCVVGKEDKTESQSVVDLSGYEQIVYISHINSPSDFYVQFDGAEVALEVIKEELADTSSLEIIESVTDQIKDNVIGALFNEDETWYRAKVLNTNDDGAEVLFIDYGNSASSAKFVKLPELLTNKPAVAMHCALRGEQWPEEVVSYFTEISGDGAVPFRMKIVEESYPKIVSLVMDEDKIVEEEINQRFGKVKTETVTDTPTIPVETEENRDNSLIKTVFCIQVNSPCDFFLQTSEATQKLEEISDQLTEAENYPSIEEKDVVGGKIVAAQFDEDDSWYRAKIIEHSEGETKVIFVDYGNIAKVAKMKQLPEELVSTPPLAMHCALQMIGVSEWSPKACQTFKKLANDDGVSFDLKVISEGDPNEVILYLNGESVAEQLVLASGLVTEETVNPQEILKAGIKTEDAAAPMSSDEEPSEMETKEEDLQTTDKSSGDNRLVTEETVNPQEILQEETKTEDAAAPLSSNEELSETKEDDLEATDKSSGDNRLVTEETVNPQEILQEEAKTEDAAAPLSSNEEPIEMDTKEDDLPTTVKSSADNLKVAEISHYNSPSDFFVQYSQDQEELSTITKEMAEAENFEAILDEDNILAAKYTIDDIWYRAKILDTNDSGSTVLFVDYGNTEVASEFRKLPKHLAEKKPLAQHCCLKSPTKTWAESSKENMEGLVKLGEPIFNVKVLEEGDPCVVDIFVKDRSLTETFLAEEGMENQKDMEKMVIDSVGNRVVDNLNRDVKIITGELICNAVSSSDNNNVDSNKEMQTITDELICNAVSSSDNAVPSRLNEQLIDKSESTDKPPLISENLVLQCGEDNVATDDKNPQNTTNGHSSDEETGPKDGIDASKKSTETVSNSSKDESSKAVCNGSPAIRRRSNIDEHIVPGCISSVKLDESPEQS